MSGIKFQRNILFRYWFKSQPTKQMNTFSVEGRVFMTKFGLFLYKWSPFDHEEEAGVTPLDSRMHDE